jgi:hypothetical protein
VIVVAPPTVLAAIDNLTGDLRYRFRLLARAPGLAIFAAPAIALGESVVKGCA